MSDEVDEIFEKGDTVLLTLKNGAHYVGEFYYMDDLGVQIFLESKTVWNTKKIIKSNKDKNFESFVNESYKEQLAKLVSEKDWYDKFLEYFTEPLNINYDQYDIQDAVRKELYLDCREQCRKLWHKPVVDKETVVEEVSTPTLKPFKTPIPTLVVWSRIDEISGVEAMLENAEIENFAKSLENGEFDRMLKEAELDGPTIDCEETENKNDGE